MCTISYWCWRYELWLCWQQEYILFSHHTQTSTNTIHVYRTLFDNHKYDIVVRTFYSGDVTHKTGTHTQTHNTPPICHYWQKKKWINIISMLKQIARHFVGKRWTIIQFTVSDVCACQNFLCSSVSVGQNLFRTITENLSQKASNYSFVFCIFFVFC